jgi:hypothetical protein
MVGVIKRFRGGNTAMELVLRAFDQAAVDRAERLPVNRLWTLLQSGGMRDAATARVGLDAEVDVFARETIAARMESLIQEGHGDESVRRLRGGEPLDLATLRRAHWPALDQEEAVELREDLVRYFTYGIWRAPEGVVARALALLTGQSDTTFLIGGVAATSELQTLFDVVGDEGTFRARYEPAVRMAVKQSGERAEHEAVDREIARLGQLFGPLSRMLHGARETDLRVIAYQDTPGGDGLTRFLTADMRTDDADTLQSFNDVGSAYEPDENTNGLESS